MKKILAVGMLAPSLWLSPAWAANSDYLLKIDTIDGGSKLIHYEKWIDVDSWSWGLTNTGSASSGGAGSGKTVFEDFSWTQAIDSSVVPIFEGVASGKHFKTATLDVLSTGGKAPAAYFEMVFSDVLLTGLHKDALPRSKK
jgi:type VI secretion system secreted protein Hcp